MKRKFKIAILAAALASTAAIGGTRYSRIVSSARNFEHHFQAMRDGGSSLGPVQRFVFSLVLASTPMPEKPAHRPLPRT